VKKAEYRGVDIEEIIKLVKKNSNVTILDQNDNNASLIALRIGIQPYTAPGRALFIGIHKENDTTFIEFNELYILRTYFGDDKYVKEDKFENFIYNQICRANKDSLVKYEFI